MSESKKKRVWFDEVERKWRSEPIAQPRHKPHGRRRVTRDAVRATEGGAR